MQEYTTTAQAAVGIAREIIFDVTLLIVSALIALTPLRGQDILYSPNFCSVAPFPEPRAFLQPNGDEIQIMIRQVLPLTYLESLEGYTILKDASDGYFKYAVSGPDGDLYLSNIKVSPRGQMSKEEASLIQQIGQHLRYTGKVLTNKVLDFNQAIVNANSTLPSVFPPTGTRKALLLLIKFPDQSNTFSVSAFSNLANQPGYNVNGQSGSFKDYYQDISYNNLTIDTDVRGWYTASNNRAVYGNANGTSAAVSLIREAVDAAEANGVNFANYDGDNDGKVDVVMVIHSGRGTEESGDGADIWSHRWALSATGQQVTYDGKQINDYIIQPEKFGPSDITNIGVLCHEFGHALGLPDLYDTDGSSSGLGKWCIMASGTWNNSGKTPAHMSVWCKEELGWINPTVLNGTGTISNFNSIDAGPQAYRLNTPVATEYFLLENRQQTGWDTYLPGHGLTVYHVDVSKSNNKDENRYLVNLEQADGLNHLNNKVNSGDDKDPFPGSTNNTIFNCYSTPNTNTYDSNSSNQNINGISENNGVISFEYSPCQSCSGTPDVVNTMIDVISGCAGVSANLSLSSTSSAAGITYQWQSSSNGTSFVNIPNANEITLQIILEETTWYRCKITCQNSGQSSYSTSKKIERVTGASCYCDAGAIASNYEKISRIQFNTIDKSSTSTLGYEDFTNLTTNVNPGTTYSFTATISNAFSDDQIIVWIDYNGDGDFTDSGELVYTSNTGPGPHSANITIPPNAIAGSTRMRVRLHDSNLGQNNTPCDNSQYGQVEDYSILIGSGNSGDCDDTITLASPTDDLMSGTMKSEVNLELFAKNQVMGGQLTLDAGHSVELQPGFSVMSGAELTVQIDGCGNQ